MYVRVFTPTVCMPIRFHFYIPPCLSECMLLRFLIPGKFSPYMYLVSHPPKIDWYLLCWCVVDRSIKESRHNKGPSVPPRQNDQMIK